jgi:hypothetical protein
MADQLAIVPAELVNAPFHKAWVKRIVKGVGKRHIDDVIAENGALKENVECKLREAEILQSAHEAEVNETRAQLDQAIEGNTAATGRRRKMFPRLSTMSSLQLAYSVN